MVNKKLLYFASYCKTNDSKWNSPGANSKIIQTIKLVSKLKKDIYFINFTPCERVSLSVKTKNICSSFNPFVYRLQILLSFYKLKNFFNKENNENKENKELILLIYNACFTSFLFYLSMRLNGIKPYLIIQVEDLPFARSSNSGIKGLVDQFTFRFLFRRSRINLFASQTMLDNAQGEFNLNSKSYIYPPSLADEYLTLIRNRKEPFSNQEIIIMYAGSFLKEKGIFNLIEAFIEANMKYAELHLYGFDIKVIIDKYKNYKSIKFFGIVSSNILYQAYSKADVVVNPHLRIKNNKYIFPCKNIEIIASGALPLLSIYSFYGEKNFSIPKKCFYESKKELSHLIKNAEGLWAKESKEIKELSENIRKIFSSKYIEKNIIEKIRAL